MVIVNILRNDTSLVSQLVGPEDALVSGRNWRTKSFLRRVKQWGVIQNADITDYRRRILWFFRTLSFKSCANHRAGRPAWHGVVRSLLARDDRHYVESRYLLTFTDLLTSTCHDSSHGWTTRGFPDRFRTSPNYADTKIWLKFEGW